MIPLLLSLLFLLSSSLYSYELTTFYGNCRIKEPVLIELIECPSMQRLKNIHQYGVSYFISDMKPYSRFEHSLGVFFLVKKFGGSLHEQIAALLHDVSHTAFSHVGDHVFKHYCHKNSYQDNIHQWFLAQTEIPTILEKYGISCDDIDHKKNNFLMLETNIPNLCADRIEYILYGGFIENQLSQEDIKQIIAALQFENDTWFFDNKEAAKKISLTSLYLTENTFGSAWNFVVYKWAAKALRRAVKIGLITLHDIHFSTDPIIWQKLCQSDDQKIIKLVDNLCNAHNRYKSVLENDPHDFYIAGKFRGVDPLIKKANYSQRLTEINPLFSNTYKQLQEKIKKGWYIQFT